MDRGRDPVERAADDENLQGIATWQPRTTFDRIANGFANSLLPTARGILVFAAVIITGAILVFSTIDTPQLPVVGVFILASVVPALLLAGYVYVADVTTQEPLDLIAVTFALGFVFASFAAVVNTASEGIFQAVGLLGILAYYILIVAPGEELVKLLAVRFWAFRDDRFDAVVDGAVYGAIAGLGFATVENIIYVSGFVQGATAGTIIEQSLDIAGRRSLAGPGHVIYSAIAGYYLGLAKFNRKYAGALVVKGIAIAAALHAAYNILVAIAPGLIAAVFGLSRLVAFVVFVLVFDGLAGGYLLVKLRRYRRAYNGLDAGRFRSDVQDTDQADGRPDHAAGRAGDDPSEARDAPEHRRENKARNPDDDADGPPDDPWN